MGEDGVNGAGPPEEFRREDGRWSEDRGIWGEEGTDADCIQAGLVLLLDVDISSSAFRWSSEELILNEIVAEAGIEVPA